MKDITIEFLQNNQTELEKHIEESAWLCKKVEELERENEQLKEENKKLKRALNSVKVHSEYTQYLLENIGI